MAIFRNLTTKNISFGRNTRSPQFKAEDSEDTTDTEELTRCMAGMPFSSAIRHGQRWSGEEDNQLRQEIENGVALEEIAENHGRTQNAIEERANRILYHSCRIYSFNNE